MRLAEPRIPPLAPEEMTEEQREIALKASPGPARLLNITRTLARHPRLLKRWNVFAGHVLARSSLPPRERELAILRVGWLCRSEYEWAQHLVIGREAGLTDEEMERIKEGPDAPGWTPEEATLLRAVDELHGDAFVTDPTWEALSRTWTEEQLMDLVFTVGQYHLVSMALNTFGVQLDPGLRGFR